IKVQNINIRGAIFDMDRLILDNISIYKKIYTEVVKKIGYYLEDEVYKCMLGIPHEDSNIILRKVFRKNFPIDRFE
ncbi:hypothetical protein, partial [Richelia intracellularis]|uniref:hypothetical protein n=1 Tax=Richelia intracellularis TaxID=1164990 RepID=UPI0005C6592A